MPTKLQEPLKGQIKHFCKSMSTLYLLLALNSLSAQVFDINQSILLNSERSYITPTAGIGNNHLSGERQRLEKLIFEAKISPNYYIRIGKKDRLGLELTPSVLIRMFNIKSLPILTPSFIPTLKVYHRTNWLNKLLDIALPSLRRTYFFQTYRLSHHSNGQEGDYFSQLDQDVNLKDGNFSTDFIEVGFHTTNHQRIEETVKSEPTPVKNYAIRSTSLFLQRHLEGLSRDTNLVGMYFLNKIEVRNSFLLHRQSGRQRRILLSQSWSIMWGNNGYGTRWSLNFLAGIKFGHESDFFLFTRYYRGPDYYNLRHFYRRSALTFGILTDPINLEIFKNGTDH